MKLIHIDSDRHGSNSISHLARQGLVETYSAPTLEVAVQIVAAMQKGQIRGDALAVDTLTRLTADTREDIVLNPEKTDIANLWKQRGSVKSSREDYYNTMSLINRFLRAIDMLPIPVILLAHERLRTDPLTGVTKYTPDLQDAINATVYTSADVIVRLMATPVAFDYMGYQVPAGTRLLITSPTGDSSAGMRVTPDRPPAPPFIVGWQPYTPTFLDILNILGYMPKNTIVYGPPKIGKTTLFGSLAAL